MYQENPKKRKKIHLVPNVLFNFENIFEIVTLKLLKKSNDKIIP